MVTVAGNEIKPVKVLSYREIVNKGPSPEIVDNIIIPDYDLFTYGLLKLGFYREPFDKLKATLEEMNFKKQPDVGEVFPDELEMIRDLSALTGRPMIVHASEVTNKNPEPITEDGIYTFFLKKPTYEHHHVLSDGESSPASLPDESSALEKQRRFFESSETSKFKMLDMDIGKIIAVQGCENLVKTIEALRKDGYEIKIGPRWGFVFDRQTEEITYDQEKRDLWKALSKDEALQLLGFKGDVQYIASNLKSFLTEDEIAQLQIDRPINDYETKKTFLDILKTKFSKHPNGSNKSFVKDLFDFEYFSETTFDFKLGETQETPQNIQNRQRKINIGLLNLDIIYQFEKIIQLQVSPKFKAPDDEEAKSKRYEELLSDSIDSGKKAIDADITSLKELIGDPIKFDDIKKELELSPFSRSSSFASPKSNDKSRSPSPKPEMPDGGVVSSVGVNER